MLCFTFASVSSREKNNQLRLLQSFESGYKQIFGYLLNVCLCRDSNPAPAAWSAFTLWTELHVYCYRTSYTLNSICCVQNRSTKIFIWRYFFRAVVAAYLSKLFLKCYGTWCITPIDHTRRIISAIPYRDSTQIFFANFIMVREQNCGHFCELYCESLKNTQKNRFFLRTLL